MKTTADRIVIVLLTLLCAVVATPLAAQQPAPVSSASATLAGPRIEAALPRFEPSLSDSRTSVAGLAASSSSNHTVTFSTLTLVLAVIIIVLLVH